ncbi:MAG: hypothetical protein Q8N91_06265 [Candidatus Omnitrophota bacterium]|nr:hypothetical protein [Candidatus Omnitrophota bacterium]
MKKWIMVFVLFFTIANCCGCAGLSKKFIRKRKEPVKKPRIYQVRIYDKKPTPELYKKHYAYWMAWQSELISDLGQSHKKDARCIEEIVGNLIDMRNMLVKEKADGLEGHIDKLAGVRDVIVAEQLSQFNRHLIKGVLEREDRAVKKKFNFNRVKNYLKTSFEDESEVLPQGV